jgi:hypothetical protein
VNASPNDSFPRNEVLGGLIEPLFSAGRRDGCVERNGSERRPKVPRSRDDKSAGWVKRADGGGG